MTFKTKHVSDEKFEEYSNMSEDELVAMLKVQDAFLETQVDKKKKSEILKETRAEINEYRKIWGKENPQALETIATLKEEIKDIEAGRDAKIEQDLEDKKEMEAGFNELIAGAKEHVGALVYCLRFHQ